MRQRAFHSPEALTCLAFLQISTKGSDFLMWLPNFFLKASIFSRDSITVRLYCTLTLVSRISRSLIALPLAVRVSKSSCVWGDRCVCVCVCVCVCASLYAYYYTLYMHVCMYIKLQLIITNIINSPKGTHSLYLHTCAIICISL